MITVTDLDKQGPWILGYSGITGDNLDRAMSIIRELITAGHDTTEAVRKIASITACGKVLGSELQALDNAGLNATARIAGYRGETEAQTRTAASRGEVSDRHFLDALAT